MWMPLKGSPVQNYHNFKRKSKSFPTDWCKNDENRIRNNGVCDILTISIFFVKTFLEVLMNIQMSELVMSPPLASPFVMYIIHEILKIFIFFQIQVKAYPCIKIYQNKHGFLIYFGMEIRQGLALLIAEIWDFCQFCTWNVSENCEVMISSNSLHLQYS